MEAAYELSKSPPTHDFVNWLARVEYARQASGDKYLKVRVVPGMRYFSERDLQYTPERRDWKIENLLLPLARLAPSVIEATRGAGTQTLSYLPPGSPKPPFFKAPNIAKDIIAGILPKHAVVITLRNCEYEIERNSLFAEWIKVAEWLKANGKFPIFVPDAEADMRCTNLPNPFPEYVAASHNFDLRLALYEAAELNLMPNSGTLMTALYSDVSLMAWKLYVPGRPCCTKEHMLKAGVSPEHDWSSGPHRKQLFWEEDTAENILPSLAERLRTG